VALEMMRGAIPSKTREDMVKKVVVMAKEAMTAKRVAVRLCMTEGIGGGAHSCPHHPSAAPPHYAASWSFLQVVTLSQAVWRELAV
jgi:hypothetical protein